MMYSCLVIKLILLFLIILPFFVMVNAINVFSSSKQQNYCDITCKKSSKMYKHTMCLNKGCPIKGTCAKIQQTPLTESEKRYVLHIHNKLRNRIASGQVVKQPSAANMNQLIWDEELAHIAQCWANSCTFEHDHCRDLKTERVGQNIGVHGSTKSLKHIKGTTSLGKIVNNWFNEVNIYNSTFVKKHATNPKCGHYTQLAWGSTTRVGCGQIFGFIKKGNKTFNRIYLYCNYAESGNWLREPVYVEGRPCSKCKSRRCSKKYKSLCANPLKGKRLNLTSKFG